MYNKLNSAFDGGIINLSPSGAKPHQDYTISDQDVWQGIFRVQRNFYP
jgi:hypothetical protein